MTSGSMWAYSCWGVSVLLGVLFVSVIYGVIYECYIWGYLWVLYIGLFVSDINIWVLFVSGIYVGLFVSVIYECYMWVLFMSVIYNMPLSVICYIWVLYVSVICGCYMWVLYIWVLFDCIFYSNTLLFLAFKVVVCSLLYQAGQIYKEWHQAYITGHEKLFEVRCKQQGPSNCIC